MTAAEKLSNRFNFLSDYSGFIHSDKTEKMWLLFEYIDDPQISCSTKSQQQLLNLIQLFASDFIL